ncbi:MAG: GGDEF domain-containing protein, partial [Gallionella sp.]
MSNAHLNPPEIARETLKTLALRKIPPTPDNYNKIYAEIGGLPAETGMDAHHVLRDIAALLVKQPGKPLLVGKQLQKSLEANNWQSYLAEIEKILPVSKDGALIPSWSELIRDLLRQLETQHKGLTVTRKREGLETVLTRFAANPETLFEKLNGLLRSWTVTPSSPMNTPDATANASSGAIPENIAPASTVTAVSNAPVSPTSGNSEMDGELRELLALTLESILSTQPEFADEVHAFAEQIRAANNSEAINKIAKQLRQLRLKVEING